VSFHAHPDDEALLTAGTLARAAAEGHRVVVVVATTGAAGLASTEVRERGDLAELRMAELRRSADALGVARVVHLGYDDSGMVYESDRIVPDPARAAPHPFAFADVEEAAGRLAALLREEAADALTTYDAVGGYGHPDHVQVSVVGARAARLAGTPLVLEATADRERLLRAARLVHLLPFVPADLSPHRLAGAYVTRQVLTHEVDVRGFWRQKRAAMSAHGSQATADSGVRTLQVLLRLPAPAYRLALGREWFVERGRTPGRPLLDDIFATLR